MQSDIVELARERAISYRDCGPSAEHTAAMLDELASHIERLRAELAAAKKRIEELENQIRNPLSRALELEESLRHMKQQGGGA